VTSQGSSQGVSSKLKEWCSKGMTSRLTINNKGQSFELEQRKKFFKLKKMTINTKGQSFELEQRYF
jgi:hypothetical protein